MTDKPASPAAPIAGPSTGGGATTAASGQPQPRDPGAVADQPPPPATEDRLPTASERRAKIAGEIQSALDDPRSATDLDRVHTRAELVEALERLSPTTRAKWPTVAVLAVSIVIIGSLASCHVKTTPVRIEVRASSLTINALANDPAWTQIGLKEIGVGSVERINDEPANSYVRLIAPDGGSMSLESFAPDRDLEVSYAASGNNAFLISAPHVEHATISVTMPPDSTVEPAQKDWVRSDYHRLNMELPAGLKLWVLPDRKNACLVCLPISMRTISFLEGVRLHGPKEDVRRSVSTIESGTIVFDDLNRPARKLTWGDELRVAFAPEVGHLRSIRVADDDKLEVQLAVDATALGIGGHDEMPSVLEWLLSQHALETAWAAVFWLFGALGAILAWSGRKLA